MSLNRVMMWSSKIHSCCQHVDYQCFSHFSKRHICSVSTFTDDFVAELTASTDEKGRHLEGLAVAQS